MYTVFLRIKLRKVLLGKLNLEYIYVWILKQ